MMLRLFLLVMLCQLPLRAKAEDISVTLFTQNMLNVFADTEATVQFLRYVQKEITSDDDLDPIMSDDGAKAKLNAWIAHFESADRTAILNQIVICEHLPLVPQSSQCIIDKVLTN